MAGREILCVWWLLFLARKYCVLKAVPKHCHSAAPMIVIYTVTAASPMLIALNVAGRPCKCALIFWPGGRISAWAIPLTSKKSIDITLILDLDIFLL